MHKTATLPQFTWIIFTDHDPTANVAGGLETYVADKEDYAYLLYRDGIEDGPQRVIQHEFDPDTNALVWTKDVTSDFAERYDAECEDDWTRYQAAERMSAISEAYRRDMQQAGRGHLIK